MRCLFIILFIVRLLYADYGGGYAGTEFNYASNARDIALAKSNLSSGSRGYFQFSNPAILSQISSLDICSSYMTLPLERSVQTLSITKPLPPYAGLGISLYRSATDNIYGRDLMNQFTEEYNVSNYMGMLSFGLSPSKKVALGLNLKTFLIQFVNNHTANGIGFDLGLLIKPTSKLIFALKLENILAEMNWKIELNDNHQRVETFPLNILIGSMYEYLALKIFFQQEFIGLNYKEYFYKTRLGSEYLLGPLKLQLGFYQNRGEFFNETKLDFNFVLTGGFGLNLNDYSYLPLQLNYAFDMGRVDEGLSHMFTISYRFNEVQ